ncbi:hypothetical protein DLAC_02230 [Tieghemostelium lacteum]|uniref:Tenascin X n=1 Tax=Tieghemostelium lacteum TaxID=361077 RepID=A0A152A4W0_TIELA|nr:hypothetical protein DLAC_02230 [Tieghemostelium lacteum]|eukprot:KYR01127.1 hypothetical protein DLAC_02230 [Tieghemostelium lacteum]
MKIYILLILILCFGWNHAFPASTAMLDYTNSYSIGYKGAKIFNVVSTLTYSIGTCDINGDGKKDIIYIDGDGYVVLFGDVSRFGNARPINDSFADGINGFKIKIVQPERFPVCGDVNGDGIDDIMVSTSYLFYTDVYVIYGSKSPFKALIDPIDGTNGFRIPGDMDQGLGVGKAICDLNGDGVKDIVFSTYYGFFGGTVLNSNRIYVIFGLKNGTLFKTNKDVFSRSDIVEGTGFIMNDLYAATLTCGDINNDGYDDLYLLKPKSQIVFGKAIFPLNYVPQFDGKEALNLPGIIWDTPNKDNRFGTSSFGDFNGDGLTDMAVTNGNYSSYEVYIILGNRNENWPSTFDVKSRNSSNVIAFTKGSGSKAYNCDSLIMGDINGDGLDDLQCYSPEFVWVVYGSDFPFESVVDLSSNTSPLVDDCRGFILEQVDGRVLANSDFNNDKILDLMVIKSKVLYGIFGEKLPMSASLGLKDTLIKYQANGTYDLLENNYNPVSEKCPPTNIKVQVLNAQPSDSLDIAPSNDITVKKLSPSNIIIYNKNNDSKFLQKIAKIQYSTQRNDSIATINFKYRGYINETISVKTIVSQINVLPCICTENNVCIDSLCVPPGTTDTNAGCAKYPCTYGLECDATVNKCVLPRACMACTDLKCRSNEICEMRKSSESETCKIFPFYLTTLVDVLIYQLNKEDYNVFHQKKISFYKWCCLDDDEIEVKQSEEYHSNYLIVAYAYQSLLFKEPYYYNKFTEWIDSNSERKRLISFIFIILSNRRKPIMKLFERIFDYTVELEIMLNNRTLGKLDTIFESTICRKVIESLCSTNKRPKVNIIEFLFLNFRSTPDLKLSLNELVYLSNIGLSDVIKMYIFQIQESEIDSQKYSIEYYSSIILYCLKTQFDLIIQKFYNVYSQSFTEFTNNYLVNHLNVTDKDTTSICAQLIIYKDHFKIQPNPLIDQYIFDLVKGNRSNRNVMLLIKTIDKMGLYFDELYKHLMDNQQIKYVNVLYYKLSLKDMNKERKKFLIDSINSHTKINSLMILDKYKYTDDLINYLKNVIVSTVDFDSFEILEFPENIKMVLEFHKLTMKLGIRSKAVKEIVMQSISYCFKSIENVIELPIHILQSIRDYGYDIILALYDHSTIEWICGLIFKSNTIAQEFIENRMVRYFLINQGNLITLLDDGLVFNYDAMMNLLLLLHPYVNMEKYALTKITIGYELLTKVITNFSKYPDNITKATKTTNLVKRLLNDYYGNSVEECQPPFVPYHIYAFVEFSVFFHLAIPHSIDTKNTISSYYNNLDKLYDLASIKTSNDIDKILLSYLIVGQEIMKSNLYRKFINSIPWSLINSLPYIKHLAVEKKMDDTWIQHRTIQLPMVVLQVIFRFYFQDIQVPDKDKLKLSTVSKGVFKFCQSLATDYKSYSLVTDLNIRYANVNWDSEYSLFRTVKVLHWGIQVIPSKLLDVVLYQHLEVLIISEAPDLIHLENITNIRILSLSMDPKTQFMPPYINLVKNCPNLQKLILVSSSKNLNVNNNIQELLSNCNHNELKDVNIHLSGNWSFLFNITVKAPSDQYKSTKFSLTTSKMYLYKVEGFQSISIPLNSFNDTVDDIIQFYEIPFSLASDKIEIQIDQYNVIIDLIDKIIEKKYNTKCFSLIITRLINFDSNQVEDIFNSISKSINIDSFAIGFQMNERVSPISILNDWSSINLNKFKTPNSSYTQFFK